MRRLVRPRPPDLEPSVHRHGVLRGDAPGADDTGSSAVPGASPRCTLCRWTEGSRSGGLGRTKRSSSSSAQDRSHPPVQRERGQGTPAPVCAPGRGWTSPGTGRGRLLARRQAGTCNQAQRTHSGSSARLKTPLIARDRIRPMPRPAIRAPCSALRASARGTCPGRAPSRFGHPPDGSAARGRR